MGGHDDKNNNRIFVEGVLNEIYRDRRATWLGEDHIS
jgi:hypothetical protein